jgi:hypothetical protein
MPPVHSVAHEDTLKEHFVYRKVKIAFTNGEEYLNFEFDISHFHIMIRYVIEIEEKEGPDGMYMNVVVKDKDYAFKQAHYKNEQYVL